MAIYHWESKVITHGEGRTACGAAAYMSCSRLYNNYDGIQHDYTRKGGLVWEYVFLPPMAPAAWNDRETLWDAVEAAEKAKDSQLAQEFIVALPLELDASAQIDLLENFIQSNFVADGMCADASLLDTDGHNPHAHILVTMRPLNEDGTWQHKTEKEYDHLWEQAAEYDRDELTDARLTFRQAMDSEAHDRIKHNIKGDKVSIRDYWSSISDADALLGETGMAEHRREQRRREERGHRQEEAK